MYNIFIKSIILLVSIQAFSQEKQEIDVDFYFKSNDTIKNLKEVAVIGKSDKGKSSINRAGIKPLDLPQAIQVIGNEIIFQQQSIRLKQYSGMIYLFIQATPLFQGVSCDLLTNL